MNENLDQLREVADKIKDLAWDLDGFSDGDDYVRLELYGDEARSQVIASSINNIDHAHYLNAVRPSTVLALLDRIKYLEGQTRRNYQDWQIAYGRAEAAEAAVQRVREVMSDWDTDEDAKGLHFDLERALDGGEQE